MGLSIYSRVLHKFTGSNSEITSLRTAAIANMVENGIEVLAIIAAISLLKKLYVHEGKLFEKVKNEIPINTSNGR